MKQFCDEANCLHVWLYLYSQNGLLSQTCELKMALALEIIPSHVILPYHLPTLLEQFNSAHLHVAGTVLGSVLEIAGDEAKERFSRGLTGPQA